ncbi:hypothetical protein Mgra_00008645 [Meloidogyne graminicola]|uniref:Uncharacterized protein n=1 Tax=Meloidogyne graminicola TaxID=189291 RepID=A0A8S9ZF75_9BILA|nr:hypothetical protein Mgra_00008645 [Meloidogyne graminicola]
MAKIFLLKFIKNWLNYRMLTKFITYFILNSCFIYFQLMAWYSESQYYSTSNGISIVGIILFLLLLLILIIICFGIGFIIWFLFKRQFSCNQEAKEIKIEENRKTISNNFDLLNEAVIIVMLAI